MSLKRNQLLNVIMFIYVVIGITILYLDLGETKVGLAFTSLLTSVVPSILPTAAITEMPKSSALILALSWLMVTLVTLAMLLIANWKAIDYEATYKKISWWVVLGIFVVMPGVSMFMMHHIPDESGMYNRFLYSSLKEFKLFIILYGAGIWLSFSAGLFSIIFISKCIYFKNFKKG